jgi:hypothetical protein
MDGLKRICSGLRLGAVRRIALAPIALAATDAATAQEAPPRFELTPFAAYRIGGEFDDETGNRDFDIREGASQGLIFNARARDRNTQWEALFARQQTSLETSPSFTGGPLLDIDVDYLHFGGTYQFARDGALPFVALTAGVARFEPGIDSIDAENYLSGSIGGGVQLRPTRRLGVRIEGRVFVTLANSDGALFCRSGGEDTATSCALEVDGETLFQWEARAGLVFRF